MKSKRMDGETSAAPAAKPRDGMANAVGCDCSCCKKDKDMKDMPAV